MKPSFPHLLLVALLAFCAPVHAEVSVLGTRVVYPAEQREVGVPLKNEGARASLLQAWIADGDLEQKPEASKAPFILTSRCFGWSRGNRTSCACAVFLRRRPRTTASICTG